ncbi:MAG: branched-chain amino acid ABC transporter substrate-binding protein [Anaerolineales bacterium]
MKPLTLVHTVLLVAIIILSACSSQNGAFPAVCKTDAIGCAVFEPGQTLKIGIDTPLTGDKAFFGQDILQASKIAVSDAGNFKGFAFELVTGDDDGTTESGAAIANTFVGDPQVIAIAGSLFSDATKAAMPIYEAAGVSMMSLTATNSTMTEQSSKIFNCAGITDATQGKSAAQYLYNVLKVKMIAIVYDGQAFSQGLVQVVNDQFTALGGKVVAVQAINPGESDYSAVLADVASKKPQALFYGGYTAEAVVIVNQMKQAGLTGVAFFGDENTFSQEFLDRTGENGRGAYSTALTPPMSDARTRFDSAYLATYDQPVGKLSPYTWIAYDSVAVLIKNIESVAVASDGKLYLPRAALVIAIRETKDYRGLSGTLTCDINGACSDSSPVYYIDKAGNWVEAPL